MGERRQAAVDSLLVVFSGGSHILLSFNGKVLLFFSPILECVMQVASLRASPLGGHRLVYTGWSEPVFSD